MVECLEDGRSRYDHSCGEMLRQRLFGILADYEDCNGHDDLRHDPVFKIVAGRSVNQDALASQPTLSRFENSITPTMLERLRALLVTTGIEQLQRKNDGELPDRVTLDIDPTDVATHGPLRKQRPDMAIHMRADSGFGSPVLYEMCENEAFSYTIGLTGNPRLVREAHELMKTAVAQFQESGEKQRLFSAFDYRADTWNRSRTVIAKAEASRNGTNLRFVVTNLWVGSSRHAEQRYDDYIQRGTSEQRNDELKNGLSMDRLS